MIGTADAAAASRGADRIMLIRHGEKPVGAQPPFGITVDGTVDPLSLTAVGWQRAGALANETNRRDPRLDKRRIAGRLAVPGHSGDCAAARDRASDAADDVATRSLRRRLGVHPLAERNLEVHPGSAAAAGR